MTSEPWEIVGPEIGKFPFEKTVGDALRDMIRARFKNNAAKTIEGLWGLDPKTAKNVVSAGHVSERTLTKAARAEGWSLWKALGEELLGQSYEEHLQQLIRETELARDRIEHRRSQVLDLEERARALGNLEPGQGSYPGR